MTGANLSAISRRRIIWSFAGGKGGTGKTFVCANVGVALARMGYKVIVFDGALGSANLHTALGIDSPAKTLSRFTASGAPPLGEALVETGIGNLHLVPGAWDGLGAANIPYAVKSRLIKQLRELECDFLLVDAGSGTGYNTIDFFLTGDIGTLVMAPEPSSMELAYRFLKAVLFRKLKLMARRPLFSGFIDDEVKQTHSGAMYALTNILERIADVDKAMAEELGKKLFDLRLSFIVNMVRERRDAQELGPAVREVINKFYFPDVEYLGYIPFDQQVILSARKRALFISGNGATQTARRLELVASRVKDIVGDAFKNKQLTLV